MLDITFYWEDKEEAEAIAVSEEFYQWLARSEFSRIGKSEIKEMKVDGEPVEVPVIQLEGMNRRKLSDFWRDAIVQETDEMLDKLGSSPSKEAYQAATYRLLILQRLRKQIEKVVLQDILCQTIS
ncbi:hypothetical protein [Microseira sp. BLCC-F43]|jgi:hypothetical protein|uniref:hypothetical protein n=1 Tax=Microseira sp. BLCC-F43 TaxID=3153602 RepID=UPI0035B6BFF7